MRAEHVFPWEYGFFLIYFEHHFNYLKLIEEDNDSKYLKSRQWPIRQWGTIAEFGWSRFVDGATATDACDSFTIHDSLNATLLSEQLALAEEEEQFITRLPALVFRNLWEE